MTDTGKANKILLYYNPHAGNGIFKSNLDHIVDRCQQEGYQLIPVRAAKGIMIDRVLSEIDQEQYSRIIVAGGDGTINLCVNAMVKYDIHRRWRYFRRERRMTSHTISNCRLI